MILTIKKSILLFVVLLFAIVPAFAQHVTPPSADEVMKDALQEAVKGKKNVFLMFHASWCGWCHKMDDAMNDSTCKKFFTDNYVIKHLVVKESPQNKHLENPGADAMLTKYKGDQSGIPFWLIFDSKGKLIADSQVRPAGASLNDPGKNVGCPAQPDELAHFEKVLRSTSDITNAQWETINKRFTEIVTKRK